MADAFSCGCFGKVPQQPDYVSLNLPESFTAPWHRWLQAGLAVGQEQLGEQWLPAYLTSPIWHFALPAHACGSSPAVGTLIPSVDAVGRYFHLTIAHLGNYRPWCSWADGSAWFAAAGQAALQALDERVSYAMLLETVETLPRPSMNAPPTYGGGAIERQAHRPLALALPPDDRAGLLPLLECAFTRLLGPHALWWTSGSRLVPPVLLISRGLPEPGQVAAMLDGDWERWGWQAEQVQPALATAP